MDYRHKQLRQELAALTTAFGQLGAFLTEVAKEVTSPGVNPSERVIEQIQTSRKQFEAVRGNVHALASDMLVNPLPKVPEVVSIEKVDSLLLQAAAAEENRSFVEAEREKALTTLARMLRLSHADGKEFKPLADCLTAAGVLRASIEGAKWPQRHPDSEAIVAEKHSLNSLLRMVEKRDLLDDDESVALEEQVTQAYGKQLSVAALRGKLQIAAGAAAPAKAVESKPAEVKAAAPEVKAPEAKAPEAKAAEPKAQEAKPPEARPPDTKQSESKTPEVKPPEARVPEARVPEAKVPEAKVVESKPVETKAPEVPKPAPMVAEAPKPAPAKPTVQPPAPAAAKPVPAAPRQAVAEAPKASAVETPVAEAPKPVATPVADTPKAVPAPVPAPAAEPVRPAAQAAPVEIPRPVAAPVPAPVPETPRPVAVPAPAAAEKREAEKRETVAPSVAALSSAVGVQTVAPSAAPVPVPVGVPAGAEIPDRRAKEPRLATPNAPALTAKLEMKDTVEPLLDSKKDPGSETGGQRPQRWGFWRGNR